MTYTFAGVVPDFTCQPGKLHAVFTCQQGKLHAAFTCQPGKLPPAFTCQPVKLHRLTSQLGRVEGATVPLEVQCVVAARSMVQNSDLHA